MLKRFDIIHPMYERGKRQGITSLPEVPMDDVGMGIRSGVTCFTLAWVGWVTGEIDSQPPDPTRETASFFVGLGKRDLRNDPQQTVQLIKWMENNPLNVARFLDRYWDAPGLSKEYTDPLRMKAIRGQIPRLPF